MDEETEKEVKVINSHNLLFKFMLNIFSKGGFQWKNHTCTLEV